MYLEAFAVGLSNDHVKRDENFAIGKFSTSRTKFHGVFLFYRVYFCSFLVPFTKALFNRQLLWFAFAFSVFV